MLYLCSVKTKLNLKNTIMKKLEKSFKVFAIVAMLMCLLYAFSSAEKYREARNEYNSKVVQIAEDKAFNDAHIGLPCDNE